MTENINYGKYGQGPMGCWEVGAKMRPHLFGEAWRELCGGKGIWVGPWRMVCHRLLVNTHWMAVCFLTFSSFLCKWLETMWPFLTNGLKVKETWVPFRWKQLILLFFPWHSDWMDENLAFQSKDLYEPNLNFYVTFKPPRNLGLFDITA